MLYEVITNEKMHAEVRIDSEMAVFVRSDSKATIRRTFGSAGDAYLEITRGFGEPLDWEFAVINAVSDRKAVITSYSIHYTKLYDHILIASDHGTALR